MKKLFYFLFFSCTCLNLFGCKEKDYNPKITTGTIGEGSVRVTVSPAEATREMRLNLGGGPYKILYSDSGIFEASGLKPDNYFVTFVAAAGFSTTRYLRAKIEPGRMSDLGNVPFDYTITGKKGSLRATINGAAWESVSRSGVRNNSNLTISATTWQEDLNLYLNNVNGPGTYTVTAWAEFKRFSSSFSTLYWHTAGNGNCTVTITELDTLKNIVSGNFAFKAYKPSPPIDTTTQRAVNGVFKDVEFK